MYWDFIRRYFRVHRRRVILITITLLAVIVFLAPQCSGESLRILSSNEFYSLVGKRSITQAEIYLGDMNDNIVTVKGVIGNEPNQERFGVNLLRDDSRFYLVDSINDLVIKQKQKNQESTGESSSGGFFGFLLSLLPMILMAAFFLWIMRGMVSKNNNRADRFGKSKASTGGVRKVPSTRFGDIAGSDEAVEGVRVVVDFLKNPERFHRFGAELPKGVLLVGPPGCGKTLLARAVAGEAGVPFFSISGSEFVEMFVGVGASRVRDLFEKARENAPCIIFVDEIDAIGRHRGAGLGGGHDEREQTLNQILIEMDGFDKRTDVIVLAATNRPDILDPALLRAGRFDRKISMTEPDRAGRRQILAVHSKGKSFADDVDFDETARDTAGLTGADLAKVLNEAAIAAALDFSDDQEIDEFQQPEISMNHVRMGVELAIVGPEEKSKRLSDREKAIIAYHEMGHALVAHVLPHSDPPSKVTCIRHGPALGYTRTTPPEDQYLFTKEQLLAQIAQAMGGRAAEQIVFDSITTGASDDIDKATNKARAMVTQFGMDEDIGVVDVSSGKQHMFLGRDIDTGIRLSEVTMSVIDNAIKKLVGQGLETAQNILTKNKSILQTASEELIEKETLLEEDLIRLFKKAKMPEKT